MRAKVLLCNCKGLCPSFKAADMNTLPFELESELDVEYCMVHPQLCGQGGNAVLADILRQAAAQPDAVAICGACAPEAQAKLFKKVLRETGLDGRRFVAVDIRGTDNDGILARIREKVASLAEPEEAATV